MANCTGKNNFNIYEESRENFSEDEIFKNASKQIENLINNLNTDNIYIPEEFELNQLEQELENETSNNAEDIEKYRYTMKFLQKY